MPRLAVFNNVTLDGYFTGPKGDLSWAHAGPIDPEFQAFVGENAQGGGALLLGRITYDMMVSYWPTPAAMEQNPAIADHMNRTSKLVVSRTLHQPTWSNTQMLTGDLATEVRKLKEGTGDDITILGSGSIVAQLAQAGLIDEYQLVVNPVALGQGRTMFEGLRKPLSLTLTTSRAFKSGKVVLYYTAKT